ncbi:MAG: hypothetical protein HQL61_10270 [Magnetococcales bacterium]|nr:hypothetical protein [Nitrospirota bacterium]
MNSLYTWLAKIGVAFIFFVILFPRIAVIIPFPETGEFTVAEIVIEGGILALMIAGLHIFLKWFNLTLRHSSCNNKQTNMNCQNGRINRGGSHMKKLGKILLQTIGITIGLMLFIGIFGMAFPGYLNLIIEIPVLIISGWVSYIFHIAENIRFNVTEIVLGGGMLALLIVGLHLFLRWFSPELKRLRNEPPKAWPLRWTLVFVAIFILMFVTGISTTASIHQLIWIVKAQKRLQKVGDGNLRRMSNQVTRALQDYLDSYVAGDPHNMRGGLCIEASNASTTGKTCQAIYNQTSSATYTAFPDGMNDMLNNFYEMNNKWLAGYIKVSLFMATHITEEELEKGLEGELVLTPVDSRSVSVTAYETDRTVPSFSTVVTAR